MNKFHEFHQLIEQRAQKCYNRVQINQFIDYKLKLMSGKSDSIKVVVRVRPFKENQINANQKLIIDMDEQTVYIKEIDDHQQVLSEKQFAFHRCYWSFDQSKGTRITNKEVFQDIGKEVLDNLYNGYNATIFAYGQTGSGKSCSVQGVPGIEPKGLLQLCLEDVFRRKEQNKSKNITTTIRVTYMEIYNEKLKNLLSKDTKNNEVEMKALTKTDVKFYSKSADGKASTQLFPELCQTYQQVEKLFYLGKSFRVVGATQMNKNSSRSHAIFTIYYSQKGGTKQLNCKYNVVDLAGSERLERTGATGDRAKQGTAINKSLSALGRVINILAENCTKGKQEYVPYRESVLTQILAESLAGNSKTFLIAALSPAGFNYDETLSTLRFAQNASKISTQSKKNVQIKGSDKQLRAEIQRLKKELQDAQKNQQIVQLPPQTIYMNNMEVIQVQDQNKVLFLQNQISKLKDVMKSKDELEKELEQQRRRKKELQESRDQALKKAGLAIASAANFQASQNQPYIINISQDPTIAGLLLYKLKQGETNIGTNEVEQNNIKINALGINKRHCSILQQGKKFYIIPKPESKVFVNGFQVTERQQIKHLDRIVLGHANKFKLVIPGQKAPDELRTTVNEDQFGEFLGDKLNGNSDQAKNLKNLIQNMQHNLSKNAFFRFLELLKEVYNDIDAANQYTIQRYKKFPLRSRNLQFSFNFMIDIKGQAEVIIICKHKQTQEVLFLWNLEKFRHRLVEMQQWFTQNKNPQKSYEQFDPWFDATDTFIREKEKLAIMSLKEMREFYSRKQEVIQQNLRMISKQQTQILNSLIPLFQPGITKHGLQDYCQQYCDYYFRQQQKYINNQNLQKIESMRKDEEIHKKMIRWMQTITEDAKGRKDFEFCNTQILKFNIKKEKKEKEKEKPLDPALAVNNSKQIERLKVENQELRKKIQQLSSKQVPTSRSSSNPEDKKTIQDQYAKIEQLSDELRRRALEMKKLKH